MIVTKLGNDWRAHIEGEKDRIIEELTRQISRDNPEIFRGKSLSVEEYNGVLRLIESSVHNVKEFPSMERVKVVNKIMGQVTGYGPLKEFFVGKFINPAGQVSNVNEITEVMVNPSADNKPRVFYGWHGRLYYGGNHFFESNDMVKYYAQKIAEDSGKPFTEDNPVVDAWLADGSRVNIFGYKVSPLGTAISIRKSPLIRPPLPLDELSRKSMFPKLVMDMLIDAVVKGHANFGVFGRTDSGKSTVLRSCGEYFDANERVLIGETSFELSFPDLPNCLNLVEVGQGDQKIVTMADICNIMNRSNPDRSIVGEIRGGEIVAASEIAESTSGGFATTGHAGSVDDIRSRFPKMFARGGMPLSVDHVDTQISTMFQFLLFFDKGRDNIRTLMSLVEVQESGHRDERYRTIVRFDEDHFAYTNGRERRWIYEQPISNSRLSRLAFRGGEIREDFARVKETYLYDLGVLEGWKGDQQ